MMTTPVQDRSGRAFSFQSSLAGMSQVQPGLRHRTGQSAAETFGAWVILSRSSASSPNCVSKKEACL
jgi:hypothetical protein